MTSGAVLYVYYKVQPLQHAALVPRVRQFQAALMARHPGLQTEMMQRPEVSNGVETWMEIYRMVSGLTPELISTIDQAALAAALPAPRHTECFVPLV